MREIARHPYFLIFFVGRNVFSVIQTAHCIDKDLIQSKQLALFPTVPMRRIVLGT